MAQTRSGGRSKSSRARSSDWRKARLRAARGTAPSVADIGKLEHLEPSEEARRRTPSDVDAMGQEKRRQVVGHSYGPSRRSRLMFCVAVATILVVIVGGWLALIAAFDNPPEQFSDRAPWSTTPSDPELAAEQDAKPVSPLTPCGEPGNEYPIPPQSPCAPPNADDFQGSSTGE